MNSKSLLTTVNEFMGDKRETITDLAHDTVLMLVDYLEDENIPVYIKAEGGVGYTYSSDFLVALEFVQSSIKTDIDMKIAIESLRLPIEGHSNGEVK